MDRDEISRLAHRHHPVAAPVAVERARILLSRLSPRENARAVDLGCGHGEWLLELLEQHVEMTGVGVDITLAPDLDERAAHHRVAGRVQWLQADVATWTGGLFDVVLCVGASHAFGGLGATLQGVRRSMRPGGQALLGDAIWQTPPSARSQQVLQAGPDDFPDLAGWVETVQQHGFEPGYGHVSTLQEWDDYEWSWTGSLAEWSLRDPPATSADREQALEVAREHRRGWLRGYREQLGFVTVVLNDVGEQPAVSGEPTETGEDSEQAK